MLEIYIIVDRNANHTYFEEICDFTKFVNHLFLNDISQNFFTIQDKIRKLRIYNVVDSFRSQKSIFRSQKHQQMNVRQFAFLIFHDLDDAFAFIENVFFFFTFLINCFVLF